MNSPQAKIREVPLFDTWQGQIFPFPLASRLAITICVAFYWIRIGRYFTTDKAAEAWNLLPHIHLVQNLRIRGVNVLSIFIVF